MTDKRALLALLLLVPAASVGTSAAMVWFPGPLGQLIFSLCKIWLLLFPLVWTTAVAQEPLRWPRLSSRGLLVGLLSGTAVGLLIVLGVSWFIPTGPALARLRLAITEVGLDTPAKFIIGAAYWCLINAMLEEYVWRWFVYSQARRVFGSRLAIWLSALFFTLHHVIALAVLFDLPRALIASTGVFIGGLIWAEIYRRYDNIWAAYVSHVLIDVAIFFVGYRLCFG